MCVRKQGTKADGIDKSQQDALRSKKRHADVRTEEDKWFHVYKIIFPDDPHLPSPCEQSPEETLVELVADLSRVRI